MNFATVLSTSEIDLDDYQRPSTAARAPWARADDDLIAEFARKIAPSAAVAWARPVPAPKRSAAGPKRRISRRATEAGPNIETMRIFRGPPEAGSATEARSGRRRLAVAALTIGAVAMISGLLALRTGARPPGAAVIAEAPDLTKMQLRGEDMSPSSGEAVAIFQDDGRAPPLIPIGGPAQQKNVNEPALVVLGALVPGPAKAAQPGHEKSDGSPTTVDLPAKDASPLAKTPPSGTGPALTARSGDAEKPGGSPAPNAPSQTDRGIDPAAFRPARATRAPAEQVANPLSRVFADLINSLAKPAESVRPRDPAANSTSGGWVAQLGASGSESEARSEAVRIGARYASALHGAPIGVNKAWARGATVYRLRAVGLSEAEATALCAQVRGDGGGCFYGK